MSNSWPADHTPGLFKRSMRPAGCEIDMLAEGWGRSPGMEADLLLPATSQAQAGVLCSLAEGGDTYYSSLELPPNPCFLSSCGGCLGVECGMPSSPSAFKPHALVLFLGSCY